MSKDRDKRASNDLDVRPDGWERFERAVDSAVKSGPKHRSTKEKAKVAPSKKPSKVKGR
jgi:hypothetical protein